MPTLPLFTPLPGVPELFFGNSTAVAAALAATPDSRAWCANQVELGNDLSFRFRNGHKVRPCSKVCFVYGGQGSQWPEMGKRLFEESPLFRSTIERLAGYLQPLDPALDLCGLFREGQSWLDKRYTVLGITAYQVHHAAP